MGGAGDAGAGRPRPRHRGDGARGQFEAAARDHPRHAHLPLAAGCRDALFVLRDADHGNFADDITEPGCSPESAHAFSRGLALAHFDAVLKRDAKAERFFADDPLRALHESGVEAGLP
jgi:hypothetical protein